VITILKKKKLKKSEKKVFSSTDKDQKFFYFAKSVATANPFGRFKFIDSYQGDVIAA
jgi:hypothetical protein